MLKTIMFYAEITLMHMEGKKWVYGTRYVCLYLTISLDSRQYVVNLSSNYLFLTLKESNFNSNMTVTALQWFFLWFFFWNNMEVITNLPNKEISYSANIWRLYVIFFQNKVIIDCVNKL
jgi:hypothetical protein